MKWALTDGRKIDGFVLLPHKKSRSDFYTPILRTERYYMQVQDLPMACASGCTDTATALIKKSTTHGNEDLSANEEQMVRSIVEYFGMQPRLCS
jgi:hypothetical protein